MKARAISSASSLAGSWRKADGRPDRLLFRLLLAVRLFRRGEDRGIRGEARPRRDLAADAARRGVQSHRWQAAARVAPQRGLFEARHAALGALPWAAVQAPNPVSGRH